MPGAPTPPAPRSRVRSWFAPSNIGVPALGGSSLFGKFSESIGANLAHFPTGPALDDPFWCAGCLVRAAVGCSGCQWVGGQGGGRDVPASPRALLGGMQSFTCRADLQWAAHA
jgi:photosystem I protein PsaO